ncbi:MAG TPA: radical SAM protein [Burkholderiales bacterium]
MIVPYIQIEPTTRCNYTCGFCAGRNMEQRDLTLADLGRLLERVEGLKHVELQGEGEPLMHPQFFAMIAAIRRRFPGVGVSLITNGSLLTAKNTAALLEYSVARIFVSMESADNERFQAIRGGSFERVKGGIRRLLDERASRGLSQPTLGIAVTILRSTAEDLFTTIAPLYRELGLDGGITIQPLQGMPQYTRWYDDAMLGECMMAEDNARFNRRLSASLGTIALIRERENSSGFYELLYSSTHRRPVCPWLENGLYVAVDGAVLPCCHIKDSARYAIGRVGENMDVVGQLRWRLAGQLAAGQVPTTCTGCALARRVAAANVAAGRGS